MNIHEAAAALGKISTPKKAKASAKNGRKYAEELEQLAKAKDAAKKRRRRT